MKTPARPPGIFDREREWSSLTSFAANPGAGPRLAFVFGRRRQGKSLLTRSTCLATDGLYHVALEQERALALRAIGEELGRLHDLAAPLALDGWSGAVDALLDLGRDRPFTVVLDEFPNLVAGDRSLPSILQRALDRATFDGSSRIRLILCGSAISVMERLMSGSAPLYGRAVMQMLLHPFDFRTAAEFWGLSDQPALAFRVHAILGGTPAYRAFAREETPSSLRRFDQWVRDVVLSPEGMFLREAGILLAEEPGLLDRALYHSILAAIASGKTRTSEIAAVLERQQTALAHPLRVLEELRLIRREEDAFRARRASYRIEEPLVRFYHGVLLPHIRGLGFEAASSAWPSATQASFSSHVLGPHFEELAREWTRSHASDRTLGGRPTRVAPTILNDAARRASHEVDVVAKGASDAPVLAIGEAKWTGRPLPLSQLRRLEEIRALMARREQASGTKTKLLLFGASGFSRALAQEADGRADVELVDLERLHGGN